MSGKLRRPRRNITAFTEWHFVVDECPARHYSNKRSAHLLVLKLMTTLYSFKIPLRLIKITERRAGLSD